jgi:hypothetical protein
VANAGAAQSYRRWGPRVLLGTCSTTVLLPICPALSLRQCRDRIPCVACHTTRLCNMLLGLMKGAWRQ